MNCPNCSTELTTLIRVLYPMEQRDEVRVIADDGEEGLRVEFTGEMELVEGPDTQQGLECPHCHREVEGLAADGLVFADCPTPTCETITVTGQAEARGRNGWFSPSEDAVQRSDGDGTLRLSVRSSRPYGDCPPIYMCLCVADAEALHRALSRQVAVLTASDATGGEAA